jgi:hypothetical protein
MRRTDEETLKRRLHRKRKIGKNEKLSPDLLPRSHKKTKKKIASMDLQVKENEKIAVNKFKKSS